jgi:hypothetical protein
MESAAASDSTGLTAEGGPLDPVLDQRCFTCPAQRQRLEGLTALDENRRVACRRFIAAQD